MSKIENKVLTIIRESLTPSEPAKVVESANVDPQQGKRAIKNLVDRGEVEVTIDWKLKAKQ